MLCAIRTGKVRFTAGEEQGSVAVGEGVATVSKNQVIVLVSSMQEK
jgi:F0F1-type ATP synthase epsilon subunit